MLSCVSYNFQDFVENPAKPCWNPLKTLQGSTQGYQHHACWIPHVLLPTWLCLEVSMSNRKGSVKNDFSVLASVFVKTGFLGKETKFQKSTRILFFLSIWWVEWRKKSVLALQEKSVKSLQEASLMVSENMLLETLAKNGSCQKSC